MPQVAPVLLDVFAYLRLRFRSVYMTGYQIYPYPADLFLRLDVTK